jgi:hypothetical protein
VALIGVLCLGGASSAATSPAEPLFGLVATPVGNGPPEASLARLHPVELRPVGATLRLGRFYPYANPFVRSPDGRLGAVAHGETLWVIDLVRLALVWTVDVKARSPGRVLPIDRLSWPSRRRLIAASVHSSEVVVLDPVARRIQRLAVPPELVDATPTASGMVLLAGRYGEPLRIVSIDQRRRIFVLKRLWRGIEQRPSGRKALPPGARRAVENARRAVAAQAGVAPESIRVRAVVPRVWPSTALGCPGRLGLRVVTEGYRVLVAAGAKTYDYREALERPQTSMICAVRTNEEINVPDNNLLRSGAAAMHVTDAVLAAERGGARGFVVTSGGVLSVLDLRSGRVRYRKLGPAITGPQDYRAAHVSGDVLVASGASMAPYETNGVFLVNTTTGRGRRIGGSQCGWETWRGAVALLGSHATVSRSSTLGVASSTR